MRHERPTIPSPKPNSKLLSVQAERPTSEFHRLPTPQADTLNLFSSNLAWWLINRRAANRRIESRGGLLISIAVLYGLVSYLFL